MKVRYNVGDCFCHVGDVFDVKNWSSTSQSWHQYRPSPTSMWSASLLLTALSFTNISDVTLKPRQEQNRNFEDLIRKCDIIEGESEDL